MQLALKQLCNLSFGNRGVRVPTVGGSSVVLIRFGCVVISKVMLKMYCYFPGLYKHRYAHTQIPTQAEHSATH